MSTMIDERRSILVAEQLSVGYRSRRTTREVLEGVSIRIGRGEVVCLIGTNGAGKSTLLRTLAGMQPALDGRVVIDGTEIGSMALRDLARLVSVVLTERIDTGFLDAYSVVALGRHPYTGWAGTLSSEDRRIVLSALRELNIEHLAARSIVELSDGERQKVMIARALAQETPVIILDEPTAFLDVPGRADIMQLLRGLAERTGKAVILSTHDLELALRSADRMILIQGDGSVESGAPEDLVLRGAFAQAFRDGNVEFDSRQAMFVLTRAQRGRVALEAAEWDEGPVAPEDALAWTVRALARAGYDVIPPGSAAGSIAADRSAGDTECIARIVLEAAVAPTPSCRWMLECAGDDRIHAAESIHEMLELLSSCAKGVL